MNSEDVNKLIDEKGESIISRIISDEIRDFNPRAEEMKKFYKRYAGKKTIHKRANPDKTGLSLNNKISTDYDGLIIDEIVGYLFGHPISRVYSSESETEKLKIENEIQKFEAINNVEAMDEETGEFSCLCGYGSRVLYYDKEGNLRVMNSKPWETVFINSVSTDQTQFAFIFYDWEIIDIKSGKVIKTTKVEWYDETNVTYYIKSGGKFEKENIEEPDYQNPQPHNFSFVPVIKYRSNNIEQSDLYKVTDLIDAYDELISDTQNEIQEFVHSYLKTIGAEMSEEERIKARRTRVFNLPDKDSDVDFITKNINGDFVQKQKETLNKNIFLSSKTVDMNDEKFNSGGAESGEARKWKLMPLEFKAIKKERKFIEGERYMFKVIASAWRKKGIEMDYLKLNFIFTRSLPIDYLYYGSIAEKFRGVISLIDILTLMPFIKNPQEYYDRLKKEEDIDLDNIPSEEELEANIKAILKKVNNNSE